MSFNAIARRRLGSAAMGLACLVLAGLVAWPFMANKATGLGTRNAGDITGSVGEAGRTLGPSGLPLPRFVSLKADKVNVRKGPSSDHKVAWVFQMKGLPVEIIAEFENWRRIRDSDGEEGWVYQSMLSGRRMAVVAPWRKDENVAMRSKPAKDSAPIAEMKAGVMATVESCDGEWCDVNASGYTGYVAQTMLWGVYPGEKVDN
ncbi:MAG: SH3 domain-containing protein [Parvibaculaceae bacterium]